MKNFLLLLLPLFIAFTTVAQSNTKVKSKTSTSLAYLKNYDSKYPGEVKLFSKPQFVNRVKALIGTRYTLLKNYWNVESPIEIVNDIFIAYACRPHNCDITNFMIVSNPAPTVVPGDSTSFTVQFISPTLGIKNAFITLSNNDGDESTYFFAIRGERQQPLPVSLISFNGMFIEKEVRLNWVTATERNNRGFEILRSDAAQRKWTSIGFVASQNMQNASYNFFDYTPLAGVNTYRLKQVDLDGNSTLSNIVVVNVIIKTTVVKTFPNPFTNAVTISFNDKQLLNTTALIRNVTGVTIGNYRLSDYRNTINLEKLAKGIYILTLSNGEVHKLIRQ